MNFPYSYPKLATLSSDINEVFVPGDHLMSCFGMNDTSNCSFKMHEDTSDRNQSEVR